MGALFRNILITTDFSEVADRAVRLGFELARQNDARVTLCHVVEYTVPPSPLYATYASAEKVKPEAQHQLEEKARGLLLQRIPEDQRDRTEVVLGHGPPADEILVIAKRMGVDLVVLAPHGTTGLLERLMGGTAYRVVRHASCPVLVVR
jgi:nucleotide-binding universal stress UspA family protein